LVNCVNCVDWFDCVDCVNCVNCVNCVEYLIGLGLLMGILNAFNGKDCFEKYEGFLKSKNIPYGFEVRHDDGIGG